MPDLPPIAPLPASVFAASFDDNLTSGQRNDFVEAVGRCSNAGVYETNYNDQTFISKLEARVFDEAHATVNTKLVMVYEFKDDPRQKITTEVPAPDATLFESDGKTVDPDQAQVADLIDATLAIINDGGLIDDGEYRFARGFLSHRSVRATRGKVRPTKVEEPGVGDLPGEGPGNNPIIDLP
jgi:hypothetical protein